MSGYGDGSTVRLLAFLPMSSGTHIYHRALAAMGTTVALGAMVYINPDFPKKWKTTVNLTCI